MVLHLDRKPLVSWVERWPFCYSPGLKDAIELQAEIVVQTGRIMLLDYKPTTVRWLDGNIAARLAGLFEVAFCAVGRELFRAMGVVYHARDHELARDVALKLVRPVAGEAELALVQQRMLREGRALARIDHPNVVRVFDVGRAKGTLFVAMERAPGVSLTEWLATSPPIPAIIDVFVQCARGLAAAHAAGVVHRDFKPDNVVVDGSGHARVTDFGLAQTEADAVDTVPLPRERDASASGELRGGGSVRLTHTRGVVGTPAYMAPEQHNAGAVDERADQYAWSIALAEAVGGRRPFADATTQAELDAAMRRGPALDGFPRSVPRRVRSVIARGLAYDPVARFPSMSDAAAALASRSHSSRWAVAIALAAITGVSLAAVGFVLSRENRDPCAGVVAALDTTWSADRRARLADAFQRTERPFGAGAWRYAEARIDQHTSAWRAARVDVCRAGVERGELDAERRASLVDCLDRRVVELDAVLDAWEGASNDALANAPAMVDRLVPIAECAHVERGPSPSLSLSLSPATRTQLRAFESRFAAASALVDSGRVLEAEPQLAALSSELSETTFKSLRAEILLRLAGVARDLGKRDVARGHLIGALEAAESARADRQRATAMISLATSSAEDFARFDDARESLRLAVVVLDHLSRPSELVRTYEAARGLVELGAGNAVDAVIALRASLSSELAPTLRAARMQMLSRALIGTGDHLGALFELEGAERLLVDALGPEAPQLVFVLNSMIEPLHHLGRSADAIGRGERALEILDASYGKDNPRRASVLGNLANVYSAAGDLRRAKTLEEEILAATSRQFGPDSERTATAHVNLGITQQELGEASAAIEHLEQAKAIYIRSRGPDALPLASVHGALYQAHAALGHPAEALANAERALALREAAKAPVGSLAYSRLLVADALLGAGQRGRAVAMARRALELPLGPIGREAELANQIRAWLSANARK